MKNCVTGWKESWACKGWRSIFVRNRKTQRVLRELVLPVFRELRYLNAAEMYAVKEQIGKAGGNRRRISAGRSVPGSAGQLRHVFRAVSLYRQILQNRNQGKTGLQFYAGVLSDNMAGAYGRMFLFREARRLSVNGSLMMVRLQLRCTAVIWLILPLYLSEEDYKKRLERLKVLKRTA